ncbi:MAG: hypothetical protein LBC97_11070 [Bifidobacteriaceae bacterium]|jgi:hypothetical protein|nr:hypothetical protein [Bifidobacteriaceae bacterium]
MNSKLVRKAAIAVTAAACLVGAGCTTYGGADSSGASDPGAEADAESGGVGADAESPEPVEDPTLDGVEIEWSGYTMGIDLVTDDPDRAKAAGMQTVEGKLLKICFKYVEDPEGLGGFRYADKGLFEDLEANPITLRDAAGNTYEDLDSIGDFEVVGGSQIDDLTLKDFQPRFSIMFDIPAESKIEDFEMTAGGAAPVKLIPYISEAYAADHPDDD